MNIKGLLLGSAAALIAVSGARAADAVMAPEPEPVEYVRVCDAYGAGFFYIPGTETCLQISGYVWYQVGAASHTAEAGVGAGTTSNAFFFAGDSFEKNIETRVNFDARSETEWGTLRSYIRFNASWNGVGDGAVTTDQAFIQLGGFMMGYSESFWVDSWDGNPSNYGSHSWHGMYYGYQQRALIGYNFSSNGFFGAIALEDDATALGPDGDYMPDVVAKLGYAAGWGAVWVKVAYDESFDGSLVTQPPGVAGSINDGGWAAQIGAQFNIPNMPGSSLRLIGFWADGSHQYNAGSPTVFYGGGVSLFGGSEWSILASYNHQFSETLGASIAFQYFNNLYYAGSDITRGQDAWSAELSVVWLPVTNFEVRAELHYDDIDAYPAIVGLPGDPDDTISGYLRFTRYF